MTKEGQTDEEESQRATRILTCPPGGVNEETRRALVNLELQDKSLGRLKQSGVDDTSLALIRVEEEVTCLSDGAGTKDESNMGVQFKNSAPNSDGENDSDW